jgi:formylglycine-generating enzyme required for sulfatase activity
MPNPSYINFDLSIDRSGDRYRARVLQSCAGEGSIEFDLPFSPTELENFILKIGHARRGSRRGGRGSDSVEMATAKEFGARLFGAVFQGDVYACLWTSLNDAHAQQQGVRVLLRLSPELANLPWEYLYNPAWNQFFSLSVDTPLVRYLELTPPVVPLAVTLPLRLLVVISSPSDYDLLDVEREWCDLQNALQPLVARGLIQIDRLESASLLALQRQLRRAEYHVLHFIGHGSFDGLKQDGVLIFSDEQGRGRPLSGQELGTLLRNHKSLRLALLNACEGARSAGDDPFAGVAHSLVQMGLPAVIAMQFEISDASAILFAHEFYAALADGYGVDAALTDARTAIFASGGSVEWGTPVLFSRTLDGRIFDLTHAAAITPLPVVKSFLSSERLQPVFAADIAHIAVQEQPEKLEPQQRSTQKSGKLLVWLSSCWRGITILGLVLIVLCGIIFILSNPERINFPSVIASSKTPSLTPGVIVSITTPSLIPSATLTSTPTFTPTPLATPTPTPTATRPLPLGMALIPAGSFQMGSAQGKNDEKPIHSVTLNTFLMDMYEVTNADYAKCVAAKKCSLPGSLSSNTHYDYYSNGQYANYPVLYVSWANAKTYCEWRDAHLPTEAEWEKAARGGLERKQFPWGDTIPVCMPGAMNGAHFGICTPQEALAVGSFAPNGYGLFDMAGNVWEWTADWYDANYYPNSPDQNPSGPQSGDSRVVRGGSWTNKSDDLRSPNRGWLNPAFRDVNVGFRCAATLKSPE